MKLLKCADCGKEISITCDKCPNCGSTKQFKGYTFPRKELVSADVTPMEMMRFQKHGGNIKVVNWKKVFKITGIIFVILTVIGIIGGNQKVKHTLEDGTVVEITQFELDKIKEKEKADKREEEIITSINKLKPFQYGYITELYQELVKVKNDNKEYQKKYELYKKVDDTKWSCISNIQDRDKNSALVKDSYEKVYGSKNRLEGWTDKNTYTYIYQYKVKNPFGVMVTHTSSNQCYYDENFNLVRVEKKR